MAPQKDPRTSDAGEGTGKETAAAAASSPDSSGARPPASGARAGQAAKSADAAAPQGAAPNGGNGTASEAELAPQAVGPRPPQYMIAPRPISGLEMLSADTVMEHLQRAPGIEIVGKVEPPRLLELQSMGGGDGDGGPQLGSLVLARMADEKASLLQAQAGARLVVERDRPLTFSSATVSPAPLAAQNPGVVVPHADGFSATIEVRTPEGRPLEKAEVYIFGSVWPAQAVTDASGRATINVPGESPDTVQALYVKPKADYWSFYLPRPRLAPGGVPNTVRVRPLGDHLRDFPDRPLVGWGLRAMGLDRVPPSFNGAGIRVAVIDSGAAQPTHRNLHRVGPGIDLVARAENGWTDDRVGHGSHCIGVIGGGPARPGAAESGVQGFAPAAEIHACRIFPGGRFSDLVSALDYCMEQGVDVVNLSLGGGDPSRIVEERIIRAKSMGIACIVAAGNSGGPVQFPASTQHVLAVAAMGRWGEFPEDSYHATQALEGFTPGSTPNGYFPARFSCFGPEIDVCAPGVAIVSSLPPDGFGAWDGTSMAAPHVAGMAALVLAHHPDFRGAFRARDARRVERLFQIIKETATPLGFGDTARTGAGMPDVPRALGLEAAASSVGAAGTAAAADAIRRLLAAAAGGAPAAFAPQSIVAPKLPPHFDFGFHPPRRPSRPVPVPGARWNPTDWKNLLARGPARTSGASPRPGISLQSAGPMPAPPDTDGAAASNGGGHPLQEMRANMMRAGLL